MAIVLVNNTEIEEIEYRGNRVVTFDMIDRLHERPAGTASRNFSKNKKHMIEGEDFYHIDSASIHDFRILPYSPKGATLLTESGYLILVKSFRDDLAWSVQRSLVKAYFKVPVQSSPTIHNPATQIAIETLIRLDAMEQQQKEQAMQIAQLQASQQYLTIREYVAFHGLTHQIPPGTAQQAYGKFLVGHCKEQGWPLRKVQTEGYPEWQYPVHVIHQTLQGWLARRNGQMPMNIQIERDGIRYDEY